MTEREEAEIEREIPSARSSGEVAAGAAARGDDTPSVKRPRDLDELLRWFFSNQDSLPIRLVLRDELAADGTNEWTKGFKAYVFSESFARREVLEGRCEHPGKAEGSLCHRCSVYDEAGNAIAETGRYRREAKTYAYPMRAAISRLKRSSVPDGMPRLSSVLLTLAMARGIDRTIQAFHAFPGMLEDQAAIDHVALALRRCRTVYALEPFPSMPKRRKSEAQLDAEAGS